MEPRRILFRAPNWAGDMVMATPALRALRSAHPDAEIVVEGPARLEGLLRGLDSFDRFLFTGRKGPWSGIERVWSLRSDPFDWAVMLPDSPRAALGPYLARTPRRIGYARDRLRRMLLTDPLDPPRRGGQRVPVSMVERYLRITRHLGCPDRGDDLELVIDPRVSERVEKQLLGRGVAPGDPLLIVTPGANFGASKLWPTKHFAAACDAISHRLQLLPVLAPAPNEIGIAREIADRMTQRAICLVDPPVGLQELKSLIGSARIVLTNDTGPRQIAVALGRPVVVVMGPTDPRHTNHSLEMQRVLREPVACSPCHHRTCPIDHRCMTGLLPERALHAAEELLG